MWLTNLQKELGEDVSDEKLRDFIWNTLNSGRVSADISASVAAAKEIYV